MIGSLFKDLPPLSNDETESSELTDNASFQKDSEDSLLASLPTVEKIVRRKITLPWATDVSDMVQGIVLRLLKWRDKYREKSVEMSPDEWKSFAAKTAYNEINRHFNNNSVTKDLIPIEYIDEPFADETLQGGSDAEVCSLAFEVWQKICCLSFRQRQALLLGSQELVIYFLQIGISDKQLAKILNLTVEEWANVKERLPLRNRQIAELIKQIGGNQKNVESIARSIKKARHEARTNLRRLTEK